MSSPYEQYQEMVLEPEVPTARFHEVLGGLIKQGGHDGEVSDLEQLLHLPLHLNNNKQWEQYARQLAAAGKISTVTLHEALCAYEPEEYAREWHVLAMRVVQQRRKVAGVLQKGVLAEAGAAYPGDAF